MQWKRKGLRRGFLCKARSESCSISFMDLAAPHDDVLAQKDQANTVFLLHGYGLGAHCHLNEGSFGSAPGPTAGGQRVGDFRFFFVFAGWQGYLGSFAADFVSLLATGGD